MSLKKMTKDATKADDYRTKSETLRKKSEKRQSNSYRGLLVRKAKALNALADNEDWLDGKARFEGTVSIWKSLGSLMRYSVLIGGEQFDTGLAPRLCSNGVDRSQDGQAKLDPQTVLGDAAI
jgi:hypothetical protein